ncbi:hypothetical protein N7478_011809 [Penicillium angulare]|uniref:uncharacterized protein n=1 Tax=Penicillium angulare TaxID=116970 RepID=UPI00253F9BB2|nr:uncharacterized protein N7478_011809 [Penicillium angulare]KAJ5261214.1 hypothetical protein N7478_011809 [Penicillium angulare]
MSLESARQLKMKEGADGVAGEVEVSGRTDTVEIEMTKMHQIDNRKELEAKFVRKLDLRLLPLMMLIFTNEFCDGDVLNYLDRNNIATARLGSLEEDLGLYGNQYNTVISQFPLLVENSRILIQLRSVLCRIYSDSSSDQYDFEQDAAIIIPASSYVRMGSSFVEAPFFPGALFLFSSWYTKKELAARISILYVAAQISGAFGGLLGSAIMSGMDGKAELSAWRWLFIIEGCATIPVALCAMFFLPDYPETTKWLTEEERTLAIARLAEEANESDHEETNSKFEGLKLAFADPVLYIIWVMQLGLNTAACFTNFFPTIVETLGYGTTETLLLSAPPYIFAAIYGLKYLAALALSSAP